MPAATARQKEEAIRYLARNVDSETVQEVIDLLATPRLHIEVDLSVGSGLEVADVNGRVGD